MLSVLGLDDAEELAYRRLVAMPSGTAEDLADLLGVELVHATSVLNTLETKGLVARSTAGIERFVASPPAVALGALIVQQQEDLKQAQLEVGPLTESYRGTASERTLNDVIDVVRGSEAVAQRFAQLQRTAKHEVQVLVKADPAVVAPEDNVDEDIAVARGVKYRVAVERGLLQREGFFEGAADSIRKGVQVRVTQTVPLRLVIADRELALVPLRSSVDTHPEAGALLIHPSGLLDSLQSVFDFVWESATQLVVSSGKVTEDDTDRLNDLDAQVLSMLLAGLTDQAIGSQLHLSMRTVQRHVRALMDRARVDTRLQLGHYAARRGWL